jgi:hypothetical protein
MTTLAIVVEGWITKDLRLEVIYLLELKLGLKT